jgi:hypothetical protein
MELCICSAQKVQGKERVRPMQNKFNWEVDLIKIEISVHSIVLTNHFNHK